MPVLLGINPEPLNPKPSARYRAHGLGFRGPYALCKAPRLPSQSDLDHNPRYPSTESGLLRQFTLNEHMSAAARSRVQTVQGCGFKTQVLRLKAQGLGFRV